MPRILSVLLPLISWLPVAAQQSPLARLPANATTVVYVGDVLSATQQLIDVPEIRTLMKALDPVMKGGLGMPLEVRRLQAQMKLVRDVIPKQVAFACSSGTTDTFCLTMQASLLSVMLKQAVEHNAKDYEAEVRAGFQAMFGQMSDPEAVCVLTMTNERAAEEFVQLLQDSLQTFCAADTKPVEVDDGVVLRLSPFAALAPSILELWSEQKLETPNVLSTGFPMRLKQDGAAVIITIGDPKAGPLESSVLGDLWDEESPPLVMSQVAPRVLDDAMRLRQLAARSSNMPDIAALAAIIERYCHSQAYALYVGDEIRLQTERRLTRAGKHWAKRVAEIANAMPENARVWRLPWNPHEALLDAFAVWDAFDASDEDLASRLPELHKALRESAKPWCDHGLVGVSTDQGAAVIVPRDFDDANIVGFALVHGLIEDLGLPGDVISGPVPGAGEDAFAVDLMRLLPVVAKALGTKSSKVYCAGQHFELVISNNVDLTKKILERLGKKPISDDVTLAVQLTGDELRSCLARAFAGEAKRTQAVRVAEALQAILARVARIEGKGAVDRGVDRGVWTLKFR